MRNGEKERTNGGKDGKARQRTGLETSAVLSGSEITGTAVNALPLTVDVES